MKLVTVLCAAVAFSTVVVAGPYDASLGVQLNYNGWGWDTAYVFTNNITTMAVVPAIGARIMQYDLGANPSIWINPAYLGATYYAGWGSFYPNYGGYKEWVAPQSAWNSTYGNWPPPAVLDHYKYSSHISVNSADSCLLTVTSPLDLDTTTGAACVGLQFSRTMTLYKGSSRVRVAQTVLNNASTAKQWSVWDNTEVRGSLPQQTDYADFRVYYPRRTGIPDDSSGYFLLRPDTSASQAAANQGVANVAPGINGFVYAHQDMKIGAHTDGGWLAYADEADGFVYVKMFSYDPEADYPDSGSTVQVYGYPDTACIEVEVLGPTTNLPTGGSTTFVIDWYAAHVHGPVLAANRAGVVTRRLAKGQGGFVTGTYGIFYAGRADLVFNTSPTAAKSYATSPLDSLQINETVTVPAGATTAALLVYDGSGALVDTLDRLNLTGNGVIVPVGRSARPGIIILADRVVFDGQRREACSIDIVTLNGSIAWRWQGSSSGSRDVRLPLLSRGTYLLRARSGLAGAVSEILSVQ